MLINTMIAWGNFYISVHYGPDTVPVVQSSKQSHKDRCCHYSHFSIKETKAQKDETIPQFLSSKSDSGWIMDGLDIAVLVVITLSKLLC